MSYLYTNTTQSAATNTGLSTQIVIKVDQIAVGAIQSLAVRTQRNLQEIQEVGTDGIIEIVPRQATTVGLTVRRIVFDRKRLTESMQRPYLNIHAQRNPFDIFVYDYANVSEDGLQADYDIGEDKSDVITTIYENCWFESLNYTYEAGNFIITEEAGIKAEFVHSYIGTNPTSSASTQSQPARDDALERLADTSRRGSLDARGLAKAGELFFGRDSF